MSATDKRPHSPDGLEARRRFAGDGEAVDPSQITKSIKCILSFKVLREFFSSSFRKLAPSSGVGEQL